MFFRSAIFDQPGCLELNEYVTFDGGTTIFC